MNHLEQYQRRQAMIRRVDLWLKKNPLLSWHLVILIALAILGAAMFLKSVIDRFGLDQ